MTEFSNKKVEKKFDNYPVKIKQKLLFLRNLILKIAKKNKYNIEETLRWNEPSYIPDKEIGSLIRIDNASPTMIKKDIKFKNKYYIHFHCKTNLIQIFKKKYPNSFNYIGNRAIEFDINDKLDTNKLEFIIKSTLEYKINKKNNK